MEKIYHHYSKWEDYMYGMHIKNHKESEKNIVRKCKYLLSSENEFMLALLYVIKNWPISCEENLSNVSLNRKAFLGQSACFVYCGASPENTTKAWWQLTKKQQSKANYIAELVIRNWEYRTIKTSIMPKVHLGQDVLSESKKRISWTFDNFEKLYVSFSGGKDSTVMLHLVMEEAIKRKVKVGVLFIDLEGQYKVTIDHIQACYDMYANHIIPYWCCLPIHLRNAVSVFETHWVAWEKEKEQSWIRTPPDSAICNEDFFPFFHHGMEFEEFVPLFGEWFSEGKSCACFVGIRTDESLNRFRTIASTKKISHSGRLWTTKVSENTYNIYPIYDWKTQDLWVFHGKNPGLPYNRLYDLMHKAGLTIHQMRICQPYGDDQRRGLWLFHLIEPETWAKVVARVNGANSGALYIQETGNINGYRKISKPEGHTWKSFAQLLLESMPGKTKEHYTNKIAIFVKWWMCRGYEDGIPDEADYKLEASKRVPSWRRVCKSLLRNDYWCKGLSFTQHRSAAYEKYLELMRKKRSIWGLNEIADLSNSENIKEVNSLN